MCKINVGNFRYLWQIHLAGLEESIPNFIQVDDYSLDNDDDNDNENNDDDDVDDDDDDVPYLHNTQGSALINLPRQQVRWVGQVKVDWHLWAGALQQINPLSMVICLTGQAKSWEGR